MSSQTRRPTRPQLSIVVVEDGEEYAEMLLEVLGKLGHRVRNAASGAAALELLETGLPDVMLLDLGLPDMTGYELASVIRGRYGDKLRLVALTGAGRAEDRAQASRAGLDAFLLKPPRLDDLELALHGRSHR